MTIAKCDIRLAIAASMAVLMTAAACTAQDVSATLAAAKDKTTSASTPTPATQATGSSNLSGQVPAEGSSGSAKPSGSPGSGSSAAATTAPVPTPTPIPTATPVPYQAFSVEVTVTPATASINLRDPEGIGGANYPSSVALSADVLLSNNTHNTSVTWKTSDEQIAAVSPQGVVSVGTKAGVATITATSADGESFGTCKVTVKDSGALDVTID